jgi:hypothetical protein
VHRSALTIAAAVAAALAAACRPAPRPAAQPPGQAAEAVLPEPAIPFAPLTYVAYRADEPIRVDGRLDEAAWRAAPWTADFVDIEGPAKPAPRFRTRARMLWDSLNLYIAAELSEPDVWGTITQRDAVIFRDNDFEVFIDPDGDTHQYYELEVNALRTAWDLFLVKPYRDGGPAINGWDIAGLQVGTSVDGTLNRPGDTDRGWTVELALPWAALREAAHRAAPPAAGDQWRINFSRVEWRTRALNGHYVKLTDSTTGRPLPEDNWVWSPQGVVNMHYPEMWGVVQFSARAVGQGADTAAVRDEDVVKWLLRLVYYREQAFHARQGRYTDDFAQLGLERAPLAGRPWPPVISVTPNGYEASLPLPAAADTAMGRGAAGSAAPRRLLITQDGAVR